MSSSKEDPSTRIIEAKTAGQVLAEFRQEMEQLMLDFDLSNDPVLEVPLNLSSKLRLLTVQDQQAGRVTMEVLKYIVYEQAEEVNEEWIAYKEPSGFMDECMIRIYKEGEAPPEVLEEINKGDLPDEIRGQQRALVEQQKKAQELKAMKQTQALQKQALQKEAQADEDDLAVLNQNKRDRRTIEEIQLEKTGKRHKVD